MKVLVATDITSGYRDTDIFNTIMGEVCVPATMLYGGTDEDHSLSDNHGFVGIISNQFTSTAMVVERSIEEIAQLLIDLYRYLLKCDDTDIEALELLYETYLVADIYDVGDIVEKNPDIDMVVRRTNMKLLSLQ